MSKRRRSQGATNKAQRSRLPLVLVLILFAGAIAGLAFWITHRAPDSSPRFKTRPAGSITFHKDIAPIVSQRCASCHQPGQAAPFSLLEYADVKRHAQEIAEVTRSRYMPPWLPEPGYGEFAGSRRLSDEELGLLQQWIAEGCLEGARSGPPQAIRPRTDEWALGTPDLVAKMPEPFALAADGSDVYRNFVVPIPLTTPRYVRALELRPGNRKILHHAFLKVDRTPQSRRMDAQDPGPGFGGMVTPAEMPGGHFLTWQPGKVATPHPEGLGWALEPGADLVVQAHLSPSGKAEEFQPSIGLYFTDRPPTNACFKMALISYLIDIPAGAKEHPVQSSLTLPSDVDLLAVLPHAHFLARDMQAWAILPNGSKQWLIWIKNWDFNWQGDYRYATPLFLPAGTQLHMRYTYDNSDANPRNPHHPPARVRFGAGVQDEMAELWLQLLPRREADRSALAKAYEGATRRAFREADEYALRLDPNDAKAHLGLGLHLSAEGQMARGIEHLLTAARLQPTNDEPHYHLGLIYRGQGKRGEARSSFESTLRLNPQNYKAHGNLGFMSQEEGDLAGAEAHYRAALSINPDNALLKSSLEEVLRTRKAANPP
jgi:hypothetical protein